MTPNSNLPSPNSFPFELITLFNRPIAAIIPAKVPTDRLKNIYAILPDKAELSLELSRKWSAWAVLCAPEFERDHISSPRPTETLKLQFM
jgi:hypothetical protein